MQSNKKPRLAVTGWSEPVAYRCSLCGQVFLPPEDRSPKDAALELLAAFQNHVEEVHAEGVKN
jgi:uncharacterized OB-fold protein